ncbi:MAG: tetratricopeptide repeat protein [Candidatus Cloacimonetes bacterium]|nr:tetratricopeptide repeat protein [Candidatus Cloacimonadota bacterium]
MIIDSRYDVLERLGTGLWATVYKVRDSRTGKIYALKLFHKIESERFYEKFSAEDMLHITQIKHPNLLSVQNFGNMGKHIYYISDYYEGKTLSSYRFKPYNIEMLYDIIVQTCYALNALHLQDMVHKDIKPENIMYRIVRGKPQVKVLDFGFAKIDVQKNQQTISGSLPYVAPEIYLGVGAVPQSDYYSLGVTLYKLTTGTHPFSIEQIHKLIAGNQQHFFPKFPHEINPDIPPQLEKLILKLLEKNPADRYPDVESIIGYINRIQLKKYSFSQKRSAVTTLRFHSYFVREDYSHQLLDFVPIIHEGNGKLVVIIGGSGIGKDNLLSLFRYHLLSDENFVFDYTCSSTQRDPFFALAKEFHSNVKKNRQLQEDLDNISEKFQKYLFESEEKAKDLSESASELGLDFNSARSFIFHLSEIKPLVFIIRAGQNLTSETIDFVNFISKEMIEKRVLIIISVDDPSRVRGLIHSVQFKIEPYSENQTREYIGKLVGQEASEAFARELWRRSNGIPLFIQEILVDLTEKHRIWHRREFHFDYDWSDYELPDQLKNAIYNRLSHLSEKGYRALQQLACCFTPFSKHLVQSILDIDEKEVFFLINEAFNTEIWRKAGEFYHFAFIEAQKRLFKESGSETQKEISLRVLSYFADKQITLPEIAIGLVRNARQADDNTSMRQYTLVLAHIYSEQYRQEEAFVEICKVIELDFSKKVEVSGAELMVDLTMFREKAELTGSIQTALKLLTSIRNLPNIFERFFVSGSLYMGLDKYHRAKRLLDKALQRAITGRQRIEALIYLVWNAYRLEDLPAAENYLSKLDGLKMSPDLLVNYVDRKALVMAAQGRQQDAINLLEDTLSQLDMHDDTPFLVRLGSLYNNLAFLYISEKSIEEAQKNFQKAKRIWEKVNNVRSLGLVYNNIGDIALRQGDTKTAFIYFQKAFDLCDRVDQKRGQVLAFINFGEAYIKQGRFSKAESYLNKAETIIVEMGGTDFLQSVRNNLALTLIKIRGFDRYYAFIKKHAPELIEGRVKALTPLVKTWFYYLFHIGNVEEVVALMQRNTQINFVEQREEEFYYQILGLMSLHTEDPETAIQHFEQAMEYAQRNRSAYAQAILHIDIVRCYVALGNLETGMAHLERAEQLIKTYNFKYWDIVAQLARCDLELLDRSVPLRRVLRSLLAMIDSVKKQKFFILEIDIYVRLTQIYMSLRQEKMTSEYHAKLRERVEAACRKIPEHDRKLLRHRHQLDGDVKEMVSVTVTPRTRYQKDEWQNQLYDLFKLNEIGRMKFFIDKIVHNLLAPDAYSVLLYDEFKRHGKSFLLHNMSEDDLYVPEVFSEIEKCVEMNKIRSKEMQGKHFLFVPLKIRSTKVGCLLLSDLGEMPFRGPELRIARVLRLHLTSILMRIKEFGDLSRRMQLLQKIMTASQEFFSIHDVGKLEHEIVSFAIDFTGFSRGFLIKKDTFGNYVYQVAMDEQKQLMREFINVSKTLLSEVQTTGESIYTLNAMLDNTFKNSISVQDYQLHSIYCAPIFVDDGLHGFLYLDNFNSSQEETHLNTDFMDMLLLEFSVALKNARQYEMLVRKNLELQTLDLVKDNFIAIVSHELNTPLVTLQGYVNRLRKKTEGDQTEVGKNLGKLEESVKKLLSTTRDIVTLNKYSMITTLNREPTDVRPILEEIFNRAEIISAERKMRISLEMPETLPRIQANWEAFDLLLYNLVHNAIRFTKDFGTIVIGVRLSSFPTEEIDGNKSLVVYVQDNGIGIPEHEQENVFKKFYELNDLWSHKSGFVEYRSSGLGIGLATCQRIVELHGGRIWLQSKVNEGTTAFVAIPVFTEKAVSDEESTDELTLPEE